MIGAWLQRHRVSILFLLVMLTSAGLFTAFKLPVSLFPTTSYPRILVTVDSGDRPADRMVIDITVPLEQALRTVPQVTGIRSTSSRGSAEFSVNFVWGTDMVQALLQVQSAINQIFPNFPVGTTFNAVRMDPAVFPMFGLAITSTAQSLIELYDFSYYQLRPLLSSITGVAKLEILGGQQKEFQIQVNPAKLRAINLTFDDVAKALAANNWITSVGRIEDYYRLYLVSVDTRFQQAKEIAHTILHSGNDGVFELGDVAEVVEGSVPQWTRVSANGQDAVLVNVVQQMGANTVSIAKNVIEKLYSFQKQIPNEIQIKPYYDQSQLIVDSALSVRDVIIIGSILAAIILFLFLRNLRMTFIVATILPCVLATTVLLLHLLGMSFNIMTLGGMAVAVGLIIDDSVVMLEYIMRRLSEGYQGQATHGPVMSASMHMLRPLAGSSLATIIIFLPLGFIQGVTGNFFKALAITIAAGLIISFFYVFLAVPLLGEKFLKYSDAKHLEEAGPYLKKLHRLYKKIMEGLLSQFKWLIFVIIALMAIGYIAFSQVGTGFMPYMDEGGFILDYMAKPGTSLTETDRLLRQVEKLIVDIPDVDSYSRRTGLQLGGGLTEANTGDFFIHLKKLPRRNIDAVMTELREKIELYVPGLQVGTAQLMEDMIGDLTAVPQPIEVKIFGNNSFELQKLAKQAAVLLSSIPGVVEVKDGIIISGDAINIQVDRIKTALAGLDPDLITRQIQTQLMGNVISQIQSGEQLFGIRILIPENLRDRILQLEQLSLRATNGHYVSLHNLASMTIERGQAQITRENLKPMIAATGRIEGRDLGSTMQDVKRLMQKLNLPPGFYIEYGGLYQEQQKSFYDLFIVFISAILLVSVLLLFLYENFFILLSILTTTLLSLSGVFLGLWLSGTELNISAMMGMITIIGMITEIAIFYFAELSSYARPTAHELINAGIMRMRPILMTTLIAILALLPLALGFGVGAKMQQPLAISIISGLIFALPLVLFIMPTMHFFMLKRRVIN